MVRKQYPTSVILPILCIVALFHCDTLERQIDPEIVGTWELARIKIGIDSFSGGDSGTSQYVSAEEYGTLITLILRNDGSFAMSYARENETLEHQGTWWTEFPWLSLRYDSGYEAKGRYEMLDSKLYYGCQGALGDSEGLGWTQSFTYYFEFTRQ